MVVAVTVVAVTVVVVDVETNSSAPSGHLGVYGSAVVVVGASVGGITGQLSHNTGHDSTRTWNREHKNASTLHSKGSSTLPLQFGVKSSSVVVNAVLAEDAWVVVLTNEVHTLVPVNLHGPTVSKSH
jgi:hypothetical protein